MTGAPIANAPRMSSEHRVLTYDLGASTLSRLECSKQCTTCMTVGSEGSFVSGTLSQSEPMQSRERIDSTDATGTALFRRHLTIAFDSSESQSNKLTDDDTKMAIPISLNAQRFKAHEYFRGSTMKVFSLPEATSEGDAAQSSASRAREECTLFDISENNLRNGLSDLAYSSMSKDPHSEIQGKSHKIFQIETSEVNELFGNSVLPSRRAIGEGCSPLLDADPEATLDLDAPSTYILPSPHLLHGSIQTESPVPVESHYVEDFKYDDVDIWTDDEEEEKEYAAFNGLVGHVEGLASTMYSNEDISESISSYKEGVQRGSGLFKGVDRAEDTAEVSASKKEISQLKTELQKTNQEVIQLNTMIASILTILDSRNML